MLENLKNNPKTNSMKKTLLTLALVALSAAATYAQGTIQFANSALTKIKYEQTAGVLVDAPVGVAVFGVYWGASADQLTLVPTLANVTTAGIINGGSVFAIPGSAEGQTVFMQIKAWDASAANFAGSLHQGATDVRQVTLGPTAGPGTVIWQTASGTNANRFKPFNINIVPEPSVVALGALGLGALLLRRRKA